MQTTIKNAIATDNIAILFDSAAQIARVIGYADNIAQSFYSASDEEMSGGLDWYPRAYQFAVELSNETGLTIEQCAAVLAVTSPGVSWGIQHSYTLGFINGVLDGKAPRKVKGPFYGANKEKAARIILDEDFSALHGPKVEAFYRNIMGNHSLATVDRHALRVALARDCEPHECAELLSARSRKRVEVLAAYHLAAKNLGYEVALVQAVTWCVWRGKAD